MSEQSMGNDDCDNNNNNNNNNNDDDRYENEICKNRDDGCNSAI
jgi:hypothetical protein